jgi:Fur family ferric uptake transcriptional regulator
MQPSISELVDEWLDKLQNSGYRITGARKAVVEVVAGNPFALDPMDIFVAAHKIDAHLGLVTVYRTLEKLVELDLVQRVHSPDSCHAFVMAAPGHQHLLICTACNRIEYFSGDELGPLMEAIGRERDFLIKDHWLQLYGLCSSCREKLQDEEQGVLHAEK